MELFVLCRGVFMEPSCSFTLHLPGTLLPVARSHSFAPFRACAGHTKHVSSAASSRCSRIPCGRSYVCSSEPRPSATPRATPSFFLNEVPTCFDVAVASPRVLQAPPLVKASSPRACLAHFADSPAVGVSRARHRLSVTFEMLGLCCCPDVMSSSSRILSFAPSLANSTLNSAQFVCLLRCHHSSCLFMNCLFELLDTVGQWQRSRDQSSLKSARFTRCTLRQ